MCGLKHPHCLSYSLRGSRSMYPPPDVPPTPRGQSENTHCYYEYVSRISSEEFPLHGSVRARGSMVHSLVAAALLAAASCASGSGLSRRAPPSGRESRPGCAVRSASRRGQDWLATSRNRASLRVNDVALVVGLLLRRGLGILRSEWGRDASQETDRG